MSLSLICVHMSCDVCRSFHCLICTMDWHWHDGSSSLILRWMMDLSQGSKARPMEKGPRDLVLAS